VKKTGFETMIFLHVHTFQLINFNSGLNSSTCDGESTVFDYYWAQWLFNW